MLSIRFDKLRCSCSKAAVSCGVCLAAALPATHSADSARSSEQLLGKTTPDAIGTELLLAAACGADCESVASTAAHKGPLSTNTSRGLSRSCSLFDKIQP